MCHARSGRFGSVNTVEDVQELFDRAAPVERLRVVAHVPKGCNVFVALRDREPLPPLSPEDMARVHAVRRDAEPLIPGILLPERDAPLPVGRASAAA